MTENIMAPSLAIPQDSSGFQFFDETSHGARGHAECAIYGMWVINEVAGLEKALRRLKMPAQGAPQRVLKLNCSDLKMLDTAGAWVLHRAIRQFDAHNYRVELVNMEPKHRSLLGAVGLSAPQDIPRPKRSILLIKLIEDCGRTLLSAVRDLVELTGFLGQFVSSFFATLLRPWRFRATSFIHHLEHAGLRAIPIIGLICVLIGAVVMQQGVVQLTPFGAQPFAVNMLGILTLREVGVLLTAIMVAGRSGSAFTAEIGSMKMREEIDAMRTLGIDPMETLVMPRILALMIALPLLTFFGDIMCLLGGGLMAMSYLDLSFSEYLDRLQDAVTVQHFAVGMIKAPFAALIIGLVGCGEGLKVKGSAESLGFQVTTAVVKAIFIVIILDAFFAIFLSAIGL